MENISLLLSGECSRGLPCISFNSDENWDVTLMHHVLFSLYSCTCIIAYRLGTLDVRRIELKGKVGANQKMVVGGHILKREGPAGATEDPAQGRKGPRPC